MISSQTFKMKHLPKNNKLLTRRKVCGPDLATPLPPYKAGFWLPGLRLPVPLPVPLPVTAVSAAAVFCFGGRDDAPVCSECLALMTNLCESEWICCSLQFIVAHFQKLWPSFCETPQITTLKTDSFHRTIHTAIIYSNAWKSLSFFSFWWSAGFCFVLHFEGQLFQVN